MILRTGSGRLAEARIRARLRLQEMFDAVPVVGSADEREPAEGDPAADEAPPRARLRLDRRAVVALLVVALVGAAWAGLVALRSRPHVTEVGRATVIATGTPLPTPGAATPGAATPGAATPGAATPSSELLVDVQGPVRRPGVVRLPAGARVLDALRAAGGAKRGVSTRSLNLARPLSDGEQVVLAPRGGAAPFGASPGGTGAAAGPVDLNAATLAALDGLPGVGPVLAQRILDWRSEHGRFSAVEELQEVPGIGPATYADLRNRVRV